MGIRLKDEYFDKLLELIDGEEYQKMLWILYQTEFYWLKDVPLDKNRANDGLNLRNQFAKGLKSQCLDTCSVLEMLIAMSIRCETDIMSSKGAGDRTIEWFWIMIDNLGLYRRAIEDDLSDEVLQKSAEDYINFVLERFMSRKYNENGDNGGLFCVEEPRNDMRKVDLWLQLQWFLDEKYRYEFK